MDFTGMWDVLSSPDFDYDYLSMEVSPYVTLRQRGDRVEGRYRVSLQAGYLDGRIHGNFFTFSFEGNDEMEEMHGHGEGTLNGDHLTFEPRNPKVSRRRVAVADGLLAGGFRARLVLEGATEVTGLVCRIDLVEDEDSTDDYPCNQFSTSSPRDLGCAHAGVSYRHPFPRRS